MSEGSKSPKAPPEPDGVSRLASALGSFARSARKGMESYAAWVEETNRKNLEGEGKQRTAKIERMKQDKEDLQKEIALEEELAELEKQKNAVLRKKRKEECDHRRQMQQIEGEDRSVGADTRRRGSQKARHDDGDDYDPMSWI